MQACTPRAPVGSTLGGNCNSLMADEYLVILSNLASKRDLWVRRTTPSIEEQLHAQGRRRISDYRYDVTIDILEGQRRPSKDVDNYAKKAIDAITRSALLWRDDEQIDRLAITRKRVRTTPSSRLEIRVRKVGGQHSGVPSFFRALCLDAAQAVNGATYAGPGYHLAIHLASERPYDTEESSWAKEMARLCTYLEAEDIENAWNWFREHFPKCMRLVPARRREQFVRGVLQAHAEGRLDQ